MSLVVKLVFFEATARAIFLLILLRQNAIQMASIGECALTGSLMAHSNYFMILSLAETDQSQVITLDRCETSSLH